MTSLEGYLILAVLLAIAALILAIVTYFADPTDRGVTWGSDQTIDADVDVTGTLTAGRLAATTAESLAVEQLLRGSDATFTGDIVADELRARAATVDEKLTVRDLAIQQTVQLPPITSAQTIVAQTLDVKTSTVTSTLNVKTAAKIGALTADSISTPSFAATGTISASLVQAGAVDVGAGGVTTDNLLVQAGGAANFESPVSLLTGQPVTLFEPSTTKQLLLNDGSVMGDGLASFKAGVRAPTLTLKRLTADVPNQMFPPFTANDWYTANMFELARLVEFSNPAGHVYSSPDAKQHVEFVPPNLSVLSSTPGDYVLPLPGDFKWPSGGRYIDYPVSVLPDTIADRGNYVLLKTPGRYAVRLNVTYVSAFAGLFSGAFARMRPVLVASPLFSGQPSPNFGWQTRLANHEWLAGPFQFDTVGDAGMTVSGVITVGTAPMALHPIAHRVWGGPTDGTVFYTASGPTVPNATTLQVTYLGPVA